MGAPVQKSKTYVALIALVALAACGANGAPERPAAGLVISGEAAVGIAKNGN